MGVGAFRVRVLAQAHGVEDVAFGEDADAAGVGVVDHGRPDPPRGHQRGGLAKGVGRADGEDDGGHGVTDEHGWSHLLGVNPPFVQRFTSSQDGGLSG